MSTALHHSLTFTIPSLVMLLLIGAARAVEDFPDVSQLPSHAELPDPLVMFNGKRVASRISGSTSAGRN